MAFQGRGKCISFNNSKFHDKSEHEEDEENSILDYKIDENETDSNDNQDAEINKTENYEILLKTVPK